MLMREILRRTYFPSDDERKYSPPTAYSISKSLNLPFSKVDSKLREMRESGLLGEKLLMRLNMDLIGKSQFLLMGTTDREGGEMVKEVMRKDPPRFVNVMFYLNLGPPGLMPIVAMEVTCEGWELDERLSYLRSDFPRVNFIRVEKMGYAPVNPRDSYELRVSRNLSLKDSLERRIVRELWDDPHLPIPELTERVGKPSMYRTIKRLLDAMVRIKAFWLYPRLDSTVMKEGGIFQMVFFVEGNREETISLIKRTLKEEFLMINESYPRLVPTLGLYGSRREYDDALNRINSTGLRFVVFDDVQVIDTGNCPLD